MNTRWFSLKHRLLVPLLGGVAVAWLITLTLSYLDVHSEVDELFDAQLAHSAQTLLALASHGEGGTIEDSGALAHKYQTHLRFQIWSAAGELVLRSSEAPMSPLTERTGFSETHSAEAGHWRHFSQWNSGHTLQVQVSEDHYVRDDLIGHVAWRMLVPALLGLPLLSLWVWLALRRGLQPLNGLARQIAHRDPERLEALRPEQAPLEIQPLLDGLNRLFSRVEQALDSERQFTANAAHELRTPLAALQAQFAVARRARNDAERDQALQQIQTGLDRAIHLVDQMLQLSRLDPESRLPDAREIKLTEVVKSVCAELGPMIFAKDLDFDLEDQGAPSIHSREDWLRVLVRNLLDNGIRYTPEGGRLQVVIGPGPRIVISDSGPGIPPDKRDAVMQRFYRLDTDNRRGCGLGLAIVGRIAELHSAHIQMDDSPFGQGLSVSLSWPAAR